jgi:putative phage-type endonuclease
LATNIAYAIPFKKATTMENIEQGTPEWFAMRLGKVTASRVADVMAVGKSGEAATRRNYRIQLVCERLTGMKDEGFTNHHVERGITLEPVARSLYETLTSVFVNEIAFVNHPTIEMAGASPDGLVGDDGLIEIKCPTAANHVETVLSGKSPAKYYHQMQWQLACTGRKWNDFVSYCPDVGDNLALYVYRVERDDAYIAELESEVIKFLTETETLTQQLKGIKNGGSI